MSFWVSVELFQTFVNYRCWKVNRTGFDEQIQFFTFRFLTLVCFKRYLKRFCFTFRGRKYPLDGSGSWIISVSFIPRHCPSACHQKQRCVRRGTNRRWFDSLGPADRPHHCVASNIHFIYSSACPSGGWRGWRRERCWIWRQREKENHCLTLDSGRLLFLAKAAIITRATSNKIVQARLGN